MSDEIWTKVEIDCYMPYSYSTTYYVFMADRGKAVRAALDYHDSFFKHGPSLESECLNSIYARRCGKPDRNDQHGIILNEQGVKIGSTYESPTAKTSDT